MGARIITGNLLRGAAIVTWAAVTGFSLYIAVSNGSPLADAAPVALVLAITNLAAMWFVMGSRVSQGKLRQVALWLQLASALAMGIVLPIDFMPIYTIIWIAMATSYYPPRLCWWLLGGVLLAWYLIMRFAWADDGAIFAVVLYGTFHLFAMLTARNAAEAEAAREEVESLNRELVATQHLLAEASRLSERTRIARDLHDLLGHHLTALSINLQIAEHLSSGDAKSKVEECRALARLLLSDVRDAVSELRDEGAVDFARAIALLVEDTPNLDISVDIEEDLVINDVDIAETLLRCVQEATTNTLRHAGAKHSWIRVWQAADTIHLEVRDDGTLRGSIDEGNGLTGMRERLAQLQGSLQLDEVEDALLLRVDIPVTG